MTFNALFLVAGIIVWIAILIDNYSLPYEQQADFDTHLAQAAIPFVFAVPFYILSFDVHWIFVTVLGVLTFAATFIAIWAACVIVRERRVFSRIHNWLFKPPPPWPPVNRHSPRSPYYQPLTGSPEQHMTSETSPVPSKTNEYIISGTAPVPSAPAPSPPPAPPEPPKLRFAKKRRRILKRFIE